MTNKRFSGGREVRTHDQQLKSLRRPRILRHPSVRRLEKEEIYFSLTNKRFSGGREVRTHDQRPTTPFVKALVRWAPGKRLTGRLPKLSLITAPQEQTGLFTGDGSELFRISPVGSDRSSLESWKSHGSGRIMTRDIRDMSRVHPL